MTGKIICLEILKKVLAKFCKHDVEILVGYVVGCYSKRRSTTTQCPYPPLANDKPLEAYNCSSDSNGACHLYKGCCFCEVSIASAGTLSVDPRHSYDVHLLHETFILPLRSCWTTMLHAISYSQLKMKRESVLLHTLI